MSDETEDLDTPDDDSPKFKKKSTRVRIALAKFYGMGGDDPWTYEEIADYLNVSEETVENYINDSDISEDVEDKLAEAQAQTRMRIAMSQLDKLDEIDNKIEQLKQEKRPAVVSHRYEEVEGKVTMEREGMTITDDKETTFKVPVPDHFSEVPVVDNGLKDMLRERRLIIQEIEDLLGLEAPDKIESEHTEKRFEAKIWDMDSGLPDQEVISDGELETERLESLDDHQSDDEDEDDVIDV